MTEPIWTVETVAGRRVVKVKDPTGGWRMFFVNQYDQVLMWWVTDERFDLKWTPGRLPTDDAWRWAGITEPEVRRILTEDAARAAGGEG